MHVCLCVGFVHVRAGVHRGQKRASDPLELELWGIVNCPTWVLGTVQVFCKNKYS